MDTKALKEKIEIQKLYIADCKEDAKASQVALESLEAELARDEKPELRHGDYGIWSWHGEEPKFAIYINHLSTKDTMFYAGKMATPYATKEMARPADEEGNKTTFVKLGNIFDDMAAK